MRRRPPRARLALLAGWIFADLFLLLLLVGLAELPAPSANVSPTPSPTPTGEKRERGMEREPVDFNVEVSPRAFRAGGKGPERLVAGVKAELKERGYADRTPGFVLVFASGPQDLANQAKATATDAFEMLHRDGRPFAPAAGLGYWTGTGDHFEFKVFFLK